jgi:RecB family endonuclease NucS
MYKTSEFKDYFIGAVGATPATFNTYNSFLSRIDKALGGLDEAITRDGTDAVLNWGRTTSDPPFDGYPSHARSALKRYIQFLIERQTPTEDVEIESKEEPLEPTGLAFRLEKEMQAGVRRQLANIEQGLTEADGGVELSTSTGRLDILARDAKGVLAAIELKAGVCPPGAIEQALGYAQAISEERSEEVRAILIASEFPDRMRAAARRIPNLQLLKYEFSLKFNPVK